MPFSMHRSQNILMVTHRYYPEFSSGVLRMAGFKSYLPDFGWNPRILTMREGFKRVKDPQPTSPEVIRALGLNSQKHLSINGRYLSFTAYPDTWIGWLPSACLKGSSLIKKEKMDVIFSSYPIPTSHLIGRYLSAAFKIPWVADFRDPMVQEGYPEDPVKRKIWSGIEKSVMQNASSILFATNSARNEYINRYPQVNPCKIHVIENGYNEDHFKDLEKVESSKNNSIDIVHAGSLYPKERDPSALFKGIRILQDKDPARSKKLSFHFYAPGNKQLVSQYEKMAESEGIRSQVAFYPPVPHKEIINKLSRYDILLLMQGPCCNHQIPAKLYEYFRLEKPILALTPAAGDTGTLIRDNRAGFVTPMDDPIKIAETLSRVIKERNKQQCLPTISKENVKKFSRREQTKKLANILNQLS